MNYDARNTSSNKTLARKSDELKFIMRGKRFEMVDSAKEKTSNTEFSKAIN
jgi:hypothetical protein